MSTQLSPSFPLSSGGPGPGEAPSRWRTLGQASPTAGPWCPRLHVCRGCLNGVGGPPDHLVWNVWKLTVSSFTLHVAFRGGETSIRQAQVWVTLYDWPHVSALLWSPPCNLSHQSPAGTMPCCGPLQPSGSTPVWDSASRARESFSSQDCLPGPTVLFLRSGPVSSCPLMTCACWGLCQVLGHCSEQELSLEWTLPGGAQACAPLPTLVPCVILSTEGWKPFGEWMVSISLMQLNGHQLACMTPGAMNVGREFAASVAYLAEAWLPFQGAALHRRSAREAAAGGAWSELDSTPSHFPVFVANLPSESISGLVRCLLT